MTAARRIQHLTTAALLTAALTALPALGQFQVQQGGAHDGNQQVGSGGYNRPGTQVDYRARNLLITGNVGGGRSFQGAVGYGASGAFQGSLGSDSLFNYRRDSVYSAPGAANLRTQSLGNRVIVTRATTSVPGYRVSSGNALSTRSQYDPSSGVVTFRQNGGGLVAITGINDLSKLTTGNSLGLIRTPQGLVSINASPLTGIRYNPLDVNTGAVNPNLVKPTQPTAAQTFDPLDNNLDRSITPDLRIDGQRPDTSDTENPFDLDLPEDPLAITLGLQVQTAYALQLAGRDDNNIPNAQAQAIRNQLFGPPAPADPDQAPQAPQNPYDQLIADILAQAQGTEPQAPAVEDPEPGEDPRPRWQQILEEPEQAVLDAKLKAREVALRLSLGMVDQDGNIDYDQELPTIDPDSDLGKLLADLDYTLPRVRSLAGQDENRINTLMTRGEQELKAGRYVVSENVYRQVLREKGDDPLAKAGLIHSQMGAGMIRSAAFNLRDQFSNHPELIALRYDTKLLPETERLRWLQGRLQKMIDDNNPGAEPGLILAYLGYQLEAKPLIEFGLAVAETEAPRDPLMPVLRRIWLEGEDAEEAIEAQEAQDLDADK